MSAKRKPKTTTDTRVGRKVEGKPAWPALPSLYPALLVALVVVAYWPATGGPFVLDDYDFLELGNVFERGISRQLLGFSRPVVMLSYLASYRLAGFDPFLFHATNIALHALCTVILWRMLTSLFAVAKLPERITVRRSWFIYGIPLLFALSPIQTESVAYISSRSEIIATLFYFLGLWGFLKFREYRPWLTAALVLACFALAALSKQDKLTLPLVVILMDYLLVSGCAWRGLKKSLPLYSILSAGLVAGFFVVVRPVLFATSAGFRLDWQPYLFTQFRMYFRYLGQLLWPFHLNLDPDIQASHSLLEHGSMVALITLILIVGAIVRWHRAVPVIAFGGLLFLATLAPTTSFFPLLDFAAERRLYLPSVGYYFVILGLLSFVSARHSKPILVGLSALLVAFGVGTFNRSTVWADDLALWTDTAEKSPQKSRPWGWLGKAYEDRGAADRAQQAWIRGEQLAEPGSKEHASLLGNLGLAEARQKNYNAALAYYERSLGANPRQGAIRAQLGTSLIRLGRTAEGWTALDEALQSHLNPYEVAVLRAQEFYLAGRYAEAAREFDRALRLRPQSEDIRRNLEIAQRAAREAGQL